ncbi:hypothetical protein DAI22_04g093100 [Oryza sativa Japonica Group]|nr:hypothetical protein DAI22_04g093100 [Oryza sativa Japonica Group]
MLVANRNGRPLGYRSCIGGFSDYTVPFLAWMVHLLLHSGIKTSRTNILESSCWSCDVRRQRKIQDSGSPILYARRDDGGSYGIAVEQLNLQIRILPAVIHRNTVSTVHRVYRYNEVM